MSSKNTLENPTKPQGLYGKILATQQAIDSVPKRGFNAYHKYHYATEADILTVKETLNRYGLIVLPTTAKQETGFKPDGKSWALVTLLFKVVDTDTGDSVESQFTGYAEDNFDKAIYKATTGANKYFYLKFFGIATEDDPEREDAPPVTRAPEVAFKNSGTRGGMNGKAASSPAVDPERRTQALNQANKILALQKQHGLSNEDVLRFGEITSIKDLAEEGQSDQLASAFQKLSRHVQLQLSR